MVLRYLSAEMNKLIKPLKITLFLQTCGLVLTVSTLFCQLYFHQENTFGFTLWKQCNKYCTFVEFFIYSDTEDQIEILKQMINQMLQSLEKLLDA